MPWIEIATKPAAGAAEPPKTTAPKRSDPYWRSYDCVRSKADAIDATEYCISWLQDLSGMDLGHEGDHAVAEVLKNVRAVAAFLRRPEPKEPA